MEETASPKIVCLSNIFDDHYHELRDETVQRCVTVPFRRDLFQSLQLATGREAIVLSSPPRAMARRKGKWLPPVETRFATYRQFFCGTWDAPKWRLPVSWLLYARHVLRHVKDGDLVVVDNYELVYIIAAWLVRVCRRVHFLLVYLDGKHVIDRSWDRLFSSLAEAAGRPLFGGALLSNPSLCRRLPSGLPTELVPGYLSETAPPNPSSPTGEVHFVYAGLLGRSHGIDLLLAAVPLLPPTGWQLAIAGQGPLTEEVKRFAADPRWAGRVKYLPAMPAGEFQQLLAASHVGLNCQSLADPISDVTFPSKIFTYLSAGLLVLSSRSGCVEPICQDACLYYDEEKPASLAGAMKAIIMNFPEERKKPHPGFVFNHYSMAAAAFRLKKLLEKMGVDI